MSDPPSRDDRWLYAWSTGYSAVGAASVLVPLYAITAYGATPFHVGLIAATGALAGVPGALLWGRLAARTGTYSPLVRVSLGASALSLAAIALADDLWTVVAANAALWFAVAAAAPVLTLLAVSGVPEAAWDRRIGTLNAYQGYGWLAGLLAGSAWNVVGAGLLGQVAAQRLFLFVTAGAAGAGFLLSLWWLPEAPDVSVARFGRSTESVERLLRGAGRSFRPVPFGPTRSFWAVRRLNPRELARKLSPELASYLAAAFLFFTGFAVFFGPLPAYLTAIDLSTGAVFALFTASSAASAVSYGYAGSLSAARGPQRVQLGALSARVLLFPAVGVVGTLALGGGLALLFALFVAIGFTWALVAVTATSIVARLAPPAIRGDALGAYSALSGLATAVGSLLGGYLAGAMGYPAAFVAAGAFVLCGGAMALAQYRRVRSGASAAPDAG